MNSIDCLAIFVIVLVQRKQVMDERVWLRIGVVVHSVQSIFAHTEDCGTIFLHPDHKDSLVPCVKPCGKIPHLFLTIQVIERREPTKAVTSSESYIIQSSRNLSVQCGGCIPWCGTPQEEHWCSCLASTRSLQHGCLPRLPSLVAPYHESTISNCIQSWRSETISSRCSVRRMRYSNRTSSTTITNYAREKPADELCRAS